MLKYKDLLVQLCCQIQLPHLSTSNYRTFHLSYLKIGILSHNLALTPAPSSSARVPRTLIHTDKFMLRCPISFRLFKHYSLAQHSCHFSLEHTKLHSHLTSRRRQQLLMIRTRLEQPHFQEAQPVSHHHQQLTAALGERKGPAKKPDE